jgi:predicted AAA+ superfamily ATPase
VILVVLTSALAGPGTLEREFGNLERIADNYPKLVLSMDEVCPDQRNGIRRSHLVDFLLEDR